MVMFNSFGKGIGKAFGKGAPVQKTGVPTAVAPVAPGPPVKRATALHIGQPGSGHVDSETKRSNMTGYTPGVVAPGKMAPADLTVQTYGKKR